MQSDHFIDEALWKQIEGCLPIACVDVLVLRWDASTTPPTLRFGLIERDVPGVGRGWALVGGRVRRSESLRAAVRRQLDETLAYEGVIDFAPPSPSCVAEYMPDPVDGALHDPRHHAIGVTFAVFVDGVFRPRGEAVSFAWFDLSSVPPPSQFVFQQNRVVLECLKHLALGPGSSAHRSSPIGLD